MTGTVKAAAASVAVVALLATLAPACAGLSSSHASVAPVPPAAPVRPAAAVPVDLFASSVEPLLVSRCSPCHFPGGILHARLPWDDPQVVRSKAEGIRGRLRRDPDAVAVIDRWLASTPPR